MSIIPASHELLGDVVTEDYPHFAQSLTLARHLDLPYQFRRGAVVTESLFFRAEYLSLDYQEGGINLRPDAFDPGSGL